MEYIINSAKKALLFYNIGFTITNLSLLLEFLEKLNREA
jgi:hypothetical protein